MICLIIGCCLIKYAFLNDRRRVVVLDSAGNVAIWDIIRCKKLKLVRNDESPRQDSVQDNNDLVEEDASVYGDGLTAAQLFDKVVAASNTLVWVANWCSVDLRTGVCPFI